MFDCFANDMFDVNFEVGDGKREEIKILVDVSWYDVKSIH